MRSNDGKLHRRAGKRADRPCTAQNRRARAKAADQRAAIEVAQADIPRASGRGHYPEREPGRGHKYGARATVVDGIRFPSIAEAEYYKRSKLRQAAGEIDYFLLWPCFVLPGGVRGCALISRSSPADRWSISM